MAKETFSTNVIKVLINTISIYFSNIDKFVLYMLFPVFGQIIGILLALSFPLMFSHKIISKTSSVSSALLFVILLAVPGILIFIKAFWDYMVAYVSLNSMAEGAVMTGKVYDFASHNEVVTRRKFKYIGFLMLLSILMAIGTTIFFIIPAFVLWIYCILIFQVFTFEPDLSIKECYKKSFKLVKGSWFKTFLLLIILAFFTIYIITQGISVVFDYLNLSDKIRHLFNFVGNAMPLETINGYLKMFNKPIITVRMISEIIYMTILSTIVAGLTLPIRSVCWALWYKGLSDKNNNNSEKSVKPKQQQKAKGKRKSKTNTIAEEQ